MQELKRLQDVSFAAGQDWSREFQGRVIGGLQVQFGTTLTADGTGVTTVFTDPAMQQFGMYELLQDENPLIRLPSDLFYWLCSYVEGTPLPLQNPAAIGAAGTDVAMFSNVLDFTKFVGPLAMLDARTEKIFTRGKFAAVTAYSANVASAVGTLRQMVRTTDRLPRRTEDSRGIAYLRPKIWWIDVDISAGGDNLEFVIRFEQDLYVPFLLAVTKDASAGSVTANADPQGGRANGLVKQISLDLQSQGVNGEVLRTSWGQAHTNTWARTSYGGSMGAAATLTMDRADPLTQRPPGVVALPLIEEANTRVNGAMLFRRGDALTGRISTTATVEEQFTAAGAGAGDALRIVIPGFAPVQIGSDAQDPGNVSSERVSAARLGAANGGRPVRRGLRR